MPRPTWHICHVMTTSNYQGRPTTSGRWFRNWPWGLWTTYEPGAIVASITTITLRLFGHTVAQLVIATDDPADDHLQWTDNPANDADDPDPVVLHDVNSVTIDTHPD